MRRANGLRLRDCSAVSICTSVLVSTEGAGSAFCPVMICTFVLVKQVKLVPVERGGARECADICFIYIYIYIYKWPGCSNAEGLEETNDKDWNGFLNNVGKYTLKSLAPHNSGSMNVLFTAAF